ncbi:MAG TPA: hypothetical protein VGK64_17360 [Bryobacteraceae bacterium]
MSANDRVFLIAAEPNALRAASNNLLKLNPLHLRPYAFVLPWAGEIADLRKKLNDASACLGDNAVIAELEGGDFHA